MTYAFTELLTKLLSDPALSSKNSTYDAALQSFVLDRVGSLTPTQVLWLGASDADVTLTPTGALEADTAESKLVLDTSGFQYALSRLRDGVQRAPRRVRRRVSGVAVAAASADRVRYIASGAQDGVLLLDSGLEIVRTFPGFNPSGAPVGATEYNDAACAVAAIPTTAAAEHMFIACAGSQHVVQIYNYATGVHVATIGTPGSAGLPGADLLTEPVSVAVDEANDRLFIACASGNAPGGDAGDNGFVAEYDISTIGTPAFLRYHLIAGGLNKLNNAQCEKPSDLFFAPGATVPEERLWIANGLGDVGAFSRAATSDTYAPQMVFEAMGPNYVLGPGGTASATLAQNSIDVLTGSDGVTRLYVSVDLLGRVEVFQVSSTTSVAVGAHVSSYGVLGAESSLPYGVTLPVQAQNRDPELTFGVLASASGVVADELTLPGDSAAATLLVVADRTAGRLQRLRTDVYEQENVVTFAAVTYEVPVTISSWFFPADSTFPAGTLALEVRDPGDLSSTPAVAATPWRSVPPCQAVSTPAMTRLQFRIRARLSRTAKIGAFSTGNIGVVLNQQW